MVQNTDKTKLYDLAKCITTILVVIAHATRMYSSVGAVPVLNTSIFLNAVTTYIYTYHMPLFTFLSGCVFGYCIEKGKYTKFFPFIKNKFKKLIIPYFIFGIFYVAPVMYMLGLTDSFTSYVFNGILLGQNTRHLWFILCLFWIFLIYILLRPLFTKGICHLAAAGCISLLLFLFHGILPGVLELSNAWYTQIFFYLGILFNRFYPQVSAFFSKHRGKLFFLPILLATVFFFDSNIFTSKVYEVIGITMSLFLGWYLLQRFPNILRTSLISVIKEHSFGIYLFHPMIIYVFYHLLGQYDIPPLILSSLITAASTLLSVYATKIIRKLKLHWIIGE